MNRKILLQDIENMDEILDKTALRCDIWQDRFIYWIAKAIRDILLEIIKGGKHD